MIATFYSYRGGVGRSMAMANVGELLAEMGYRVVLCDWDLEAPGLERYFVTNGANAARYRAEMDGFLSWTGLVDLLREYKAMLARPAPEGDAAPAGDDPHFASVGTLRLRRPASLAQALPRAEGRPGTLNLLTAGRRSGESLQVYADEVRRFDWQEFYEQWAGGAYMDFFRRDLVGDPQAGIGGTADILLIDSRTGVTEQGGICTHHLADLVVVLTAANDLNMDGARWMARALADPGLPARRGGRPLHVLPVASRIEQTAQRDELVGFRREFLQAFGDQIGQVVDDAEAFALAAEIPYMPFYAFHERVVAREPDSEREQKLHAAYKTLAEAVVQHGVRQGLLRERTAQGIYVRNPDRRAGAQQRGTEIEALFQALAQAVQAGAAERIGPATTQLEEALRSGEGLFPEDAARGFLNGMRRARRGDLIERVVAAVLSAGIERPFMQVALARAQTDRGDLTTALSVLQALLPALKAGTPDQVEARLLVGRICRDLYLDAPTPTALSSVRNLERAVNEFYDVYRAAPQDQAWAGSNVFALLRRARRDSVRLEAAPDAAQIALEVLLSASDWHDREPGQPWHAATAIEASLALDRPDDAVRWADRMLADTAADPFFIGSVARNLERMWQLSLAAEPGATLLALLRGSLMADAAPSVSVPWQPLGSMDGLQTGLLPLLNAAHRQKAEHYLRAAQLPPSVARLQGPEGGTGAGFLVAGDALDPRLDAGSVLVTAAHVFGPSPPADAADLAGWRVDFIGLPLHAAPDTRIRALLFYSAADQLDVAVLRLDADPPLLHPLPVAAALPDAGVGAQVACIGPSNPSDPSGMPGSPPRQLDISTGPLHSVSDPLLRYQLGHAVSGAPIFDAHWQVVALHHAAMGPPADPGAAQGEGISIAAIRRQLASALGQEQPGTTDPVRVFFSHSHRDAKMVDELRRHLKMLERRGLIATCDERQLAPGTALDQAFAEQIERAEIVILAVTSDYLASDFVFQTELPLVMARHRSGHVQVLPVILRACDWQDTPIAELQVLPRQGRPVSAWPDRDEAWTDVARAVRALVVKARDTRALPETKFPAPPRPQTSGDR